ncbi:MAG TPA: hypothetical protein VFJ27_04390 [Terriglobia bacterium]|nr:hypothetical protein [Terriglobia bacterium]
MDQTAQDTVDETLYLIGRPKLKRFLRFVRSHALNPPSDGSLTDEWQVANSVIRTLEKEEAGLADNPPIGKLGPEYEPLLIEFLKDPLVQNGFNTVPTEVAMVELDRLVVYQHHIDLTFVRQLKSKLGPAPSDEQIFRTCLPYDHPQPPVKWSRVHRNSFVFMSPSNDLRFLGTMKMDSDNIQNYPPPGNLVGVVGLAVGFGSNFMNAIYAEKRLILNNGSHRAYALREMGFTHAPCIVQHVSSRDQLDVVAASQVEDNPDYFLKHPRPSMLIDYFNPRLRKVMPVHRQLRQVTVKFEIDEAYVPAF